MSADYGFLEFAANTFFFWLCWVRVAARGLPLVAENWGYSLLQCTGFLLRWLLFVVEHGL